MYCKRCGHQVANGAMYCGRCGLNIANVQRQRAARHANARRNAPQPRATRFTQAAPLPQTIQAKPKTAADSRPAARNRTTPAAKTRKGALNAKVIAAALVAVMIAVIGFCTGTDGNLQSSTGRAIQPVKAFEKSDVPADQAKLYKWFPKGTKSFPLPYYRSQLNGGQQRAYDDIFEGLMSMEKEIGLDDKPFAHGSARLYRTRSAPTRKRASSTSNGVRRNGKLRGARQWTLTPVCLLPLPIRDLDYAQLVNI